LIPIQARIHNHLRQGGRIWLFLDYDGTLADFAPTPDVIAPDSQLINLLERLAKLHGLRLAIISGRTLAHIRALVPVPRIWLAGTYGIELQTPSGERTEQLDYPAIRPVLDEIKPAWQAILENSSGFFLEDKGWTLAIHARFADHEQADQVLRYARQVAEEKITGSDFRLLGGHRFLEVSPRLADKGWTVDYLLKTDSWQDAMPVYIGDDDKDIRAFAVVQSHGGLALLVGEQHQAPDADGRLESPMQVRAWLEEVFLQ
jgi:trehalose 6-phosphate phosphatase